LIVEWWSVSVVSFDRDDVTAVWNHIFHDVSEIRRIQEGGLVVVYISDGYYQFGSIETRFTTANIARTIFSANSQRVSRFPFVVEIFRDTDNARVFANAEITIIVAACDREAYTTVGTFIDVGCRDLLAKRFIMT
jgi:hypothetical protein